jgi:predicted nucleic acid-binding protein
MARDALHAAVALRHADGRICSFDRDFDEIAGIHRTEPE